MGAEDLKIDLKYIEKAFEQKISVSDKKSSSATKSQVNAKISILDPNRSQQIQIQMKKLPAARIIKQGIVNLDQCTLTKDTIEVLHKMVPTQEEIDAINEARQNQPENELAEAEAFLSTLATIGNLKCRLELWDFKLDFDHLVDQVASPLQDFRDAIKEIKSSKLFKSILQAIIQIGSHLNEKDTKAIDIGFLTRVQEIKDTQSRQPLLFHVVKIIHNSGTHKSDLYQELGAVVRSARSDFEQVDFLLKQLENKCKTSWDHLRKIYSTSTQTKNKLADFVTSAAEQTIKLKIINHRVREMYKVLLRDYLICDNVSFINYPNQLFTAIADFALDYRTTKQKYISQEENKKKRLQRKQSRGLLLPDAKNVEKATFHTTTADIRKLEFEKENNKSIGVF